MTTAVKKKSGSLAADLIDKALNAKDATEVLMDADLDTVSSALSSSLLSSTTSSTPSAFLRKCLAACRTTPSAKKATATAADLRKLSRLRRALLSRALSLLMRNEFISPQSASSALDAMVEDVDEADMEASDALKLVAQCRRELAENRDQLNPRWFSFLAQLVSTLHCRDALVFSGNDGGGDTDDEETVSGAEFRSRFVDAVCAIEWRPRHAAAVCGLFREVSDSAKLTPAECAAVTERLCLAMRRLAPSEVPPLAHQMLALCRESGSAAILVSELGDYFGKKMKRASPDEAESSQESADLISDDANEQRSMMQAEGTVMFHLGHAARMGHPVHKDILKMLKSASQTPEVLFSGQFQAFLTFTLSSVQVHHQAVVDGMKSAVTKSVGIALRRERDGWYRQVMTEPPDVSELLCKLVEQSNQYMGWDLIGKGVIDLAFALLDVKPLLGGKPDRKLRRVWDVGTEVLLKTLRCSSSAVRTIVPLLGKRVKASLGAPQYAACLRRVVKGTLFLCMEEASLLNDLVARLHTLGPAGARRTVAALLPLIKVNRGLRDATILTLRKSLFDRSDDVKQIGMDGVLQLLKIFKITSALPVTQLSQSSGSLSMSQMPESSSRSGSSVNEALCSELVGILHKGLSQSAAVRLTLYSGLYDVVARNPELCCDVLNALSDHASAMGWTRLRATREDGGWLVDLDALVAEEGGGQVREPVGWFFHCAQQLITKSEDLYGKSGEDEEADLDTADLRSRDKLTSLLEDLSKKYSEADFVDLGLEKNADYSRATTDGCRNAGKVDLLKTLLEALMDYCVTHGADVDADRAKTLGGLFKRHQEVSALLKSGAAPKAGGGGGGNRKNKKKVEDDANNSQQQAAAKKGAGAAASSPAKFKMPEHAFTLKAVNVMLRAILLSPGNEALDLLREEHGEFALYLSKVLNAKLSRTEATLAEEGGCAVSADEPAHQIWLKHARVSGKLCLDVVLADKMADELSEHWDAVALAACESLCLLLNLVANHFSDKLEAFMAKLIDENNSDTSVTRLHQSFSCLVDTVFDQVSSVQGRARDDDEQRVVSARSRLVGGLVRIVGFVAGRLNGNEEDDGVVVKKISDWCRVFGDSSSESTSPDVLVPFLDLLFSSARALKETSNLALEISAQLRSKVGDVDESISVDPVNTFSFVTATTSESVLRALSSHVDQSLDSAEAAVTWCKQRQAQLQSAGKEGKIGAKGETELLKKESEICHLLGRTVHTVKEVCQSGFRLELLLDHPIKVATRLYAALSSLAKYFFARARNNRDCVVHAKFDHLVNLVGRKLTKRTYELISHVQRMQEELDDSSTASAGGGQKKAGSGGARSRMQKESKGIPNLIFRVEGFENDVIKLGKRCSLDLMEKTKISTARDFRLKVEELRRNEEEEEDDDGEEEDGENHEPSDADRVAESTRMDLDSDDDGDGDRSAAAAGRKRASQGGAAAADSTTQNSVLQDLHNASVASSVVDQPPPSKKMKVKTPFKFKGSRKN